MPNYTVNFVIKPEKINAVGLIPIYLKITIERKTAYMATGHYVDELKWNAKTQTVKDAKSLNIDLEHRKNQVKQKIVELQVQGKTISSKIIKEHFTGKDLNNIFNFIDAFCREVKHKKDEQTIDNYQKHARKLEAFISSRNLNFEEITPTFLQRYENHLRDQGAGNNYVHAIWKTLKTFFNAARKKKLINNYPFDQYENPVYVDPQKEYLTIDELKKWEEFADTTKNKVWRQAAVYFLFGCYSGLRISDWFQFNYKEHIEDGKLKLRTTKTGEWVTVPVNGPLERNLKRMMLTPLAIEEPTLNEKLKHIAAELKIDKRLSSHCARKTFAVTMCADRGVSSETCAKLMGITVEICVKNYYVVTDSKIRKEVLAAWSDL